MERHLYRLVSAVFLFVAVLVPVYSEQVSLRIPDSSEIRSSLRETWFEAPLDDLRMNHPEIRANKDGEEFQIWLEESDSTFTIFVSPHAKLSVDVYSDTGKKTVVQDVFPGDAPGSWVLVREKRTGKPLRIRYYFSNESDIYVQFSPDGKSACADFVIFGGYAAHHAPAGLPFEYFYAASFQNVLACTKNTLPWQYMMYRTDMYHSTLQMISVIRERLPELVYADDAMYDENDEPVFISTGKRRNIPDEDADKISLSSGGFVKWIADGIVNPLTGSSLKREPLIQQTVSYDALGYQGVMSDQYNLSFALDWTRNIAAAVQSVYTKKTYTYAQAAVDVTEELFSAEITSSGVKNTTGYIKDTGYDAAIIKPLMYVMAVKYPGECYLAAIRETDRKRVPEVKVFNECAVFFPYFDSNGKFACSVFKNGVEYNIDDFCENYRNDFIHLTRMRTTEKFFPL